MEFWNPFRNLFCKCLAAKTISPKIIFHQAYAKKPRPSWLDGGGMTPFSITMNPLVSHLKCNFLYVIPSFTNFPSASRREKYPLVRRPLTKHSIPCHLTTSNSLNPFTFHGAWFLFNRPPFSIFAL